ncbi:acyl carrier protein [Alkaliphilus transvaalensis]|uniref:acyl carrier protein n=1 Tax=Alkaliphilus transvaalensis TaxID=114628 RepID=UPI00047A76FF|nr:acyl carrier protein [Alkaliphilus transvaalensis]
MNKKYDINTVQEGVIKILKRDKKVQDKEITLDTDLVSLGLNSIQFVKLVIALEQDFDCEFDDEKLNLSDFKTVREIVEYVMNVE